LKKNVPMTSASVSLRTVASSKAGIRALRSSSRRVLVVAGLLLLMFAVAAPGIPIKVYRRYPTISGAFGPPVDPVYIERGCVVHVVSLVVEGDYYLECPIIDYPLLYWSPVIALVGILAFSLGSGLQIGRWTRRLSLLLEGLAGLEGILVAFWTLLGPWRFEAIPGLLGYPIGLFAILHSMRRTGAGASQLAMTAMIILFISGAVFFLMLIASIGMSEY